MFQALGLAEMHPEGLVKYTQEQQERCRAEPEELPGQDSDGFFTALRSKPVVLVRQIDEGGGDLSEDEPDAGEQDRDESYDDEIDPREGFFTRPCVRPTRGPEVRCNTVRKEGVIIDGVPYAEQEEKDKYQEGYITHRKLLLLKNLNAYPVNVRHKP